MTRTLRALSIFLPVLFAAPALRANIFFNITPEHCAYADGYIGTTVTGGVPPYTYAWSDGPTTQNRGSLPAGSYTLTVTDFVGAQQQNTAVVPNLPNWEWDPMQGLAQAIPSCDGTPGGLILFGGDIPSYPQGPGPHQNDAGCVTELQPQNVPDDFLGFGGVLRTICYWGSTGQTYAVNYTDLNGCPGYMEAIVPQPPQFLPVTLLDLEGSCSGGANGSLRFSCAPEPDYIYGLFPRLFNDQWQPAPQFAALGTNWTGGWTYDVPNLAAGTYAFVRRMLHDPDFDLFGLGCGDTTYFTVPDLGPTCGHISGTVAMDIDEDCTLDFSDTAVPELVIEFSPGPYYATTNAQGEYGVNLPLGNYSVTQQASVVDEHCLPDPITLNVTGSATFNLLDTATQALDIQLSMASGPARPGFQMHYAIDLDNLTSATGSTNQVVMTFDPAVSFLSAVPTPSNVSGNTITWNNAGALYYFQHRDISVSLQVPPDVGLIGTDLTATAVLTQNPLDANAANNSATGITTVTGSYDPNDKTATTSSRWSNSLYYIDVDEWIDYTIRFQNTGTDTAFTVVITDTLPATLDAGSITVGAGSHPFTWELQAGGTLKCYFVNILLPDSNVNEPLSHGFVSFRIRPQLPLLPGTVIENTGNIYFDYNPPVITEPSVLVAEFSTGVGEEGTIRLQLAPVPVTDQLNVAAAMEMLSVRIIAADGREVDRRSVRASSAVIDVSGLKAGAYLISATLATGNEVRERFIKH
ncbi:MAG: DUF11 domain-containing protein [Flavobacteriales bacterium]|jgi:uncharacterized repeat protein (TIGR01451 family)|nr:DUF11 domain-containing protein [Flavobacteriales bacterium]